MASWIQHRVESRLVSVVAPVVQGRHHSEGEASKKGSGKSGSRSCSSPEEVAGMLLFLAASVTGFRSAVELL